MRFHSVLTPHVCLGTEVSTAPARPSAKWREPEHLPFSLSCLLRRFYEHVFLEVVVHSIPLGPDEEFQRLLPLKRETDSNHRAVDTRHSL